ncbi:Molybdopterin molybdenumtransferase [Desulfonema limicola]|uniref:Molybdopterin molybdenumtransferase n=1 Tax=Desulfonema limicola TaxID=45656 RepID=A0A975BB49_9BACT|nr:gephyrin-like molybdotransferase Glp [Desulfonema limicola]QTA81950.1 Molybdopterin molybdenumtransferase [Desulfonema limicola]
MKDFLKVVSTDNVMDYLSCFSKMGTEHISINNVFNRILGEDIFSDNNLPGFKRATMDGYAINAGSSFGASESNPAYLIIKGSILMGQVPDFSIGPGEAARISTGGMLPEGADSVVMIEHTEMLDNTNIEVYKSVAPGQHIVDKGEDFKKGEKILCKGRRINAPEIGLLGAYGRDMVKVYKKPKIAIISTGDEIVPINQVPKMGQVRDINTYTLAGLVTGAGAEPSILGIVRDDYNSLLDKCTDALNNTDMVLLSGGSSMGMRDFTLEIISALPKSEVLVHGVSISPGKPTILAKSGEKAVWGLPGHVVSAMIVFKTLVRPFVEYISGLMPEYARILKLPAKLSRNLSSAQGRVDYVRVRVIKKQDGFWAEPVLGKSGLLNTIIKADGLVEIGLNVEGLDKGEDVEVIVL